MVAKKPNIVLILVDDMGYSDIGCYGGTIETPHLDSLAKDGIRFTQFYNTARCCPARASLLTGLYPHQAGMGWMVAADLAYTGYRGDLNDRCRTIAEVLKPAGYHTCMSGKWHLSRDISYHPGAPGHSWPRQRGFDSYYGMLAGSGSYFTPTTLFEDNTPVEPGPGYYITDAISDRACGFIEDHARDRPSDPLFLYVAYTAPHWPIHAPPKEIARYRGRFARGWDEMRGEKHQRMVASGLLDPKWKLTERDPAVPAWKDLADKDRDEFDLRMAIYAAQIDIMDKGIGRIVSTLAAKGMKEDTLVLFMSDNGGCHEEIHWKKKDLEDIGTDRSFESYGRPWANLSNVPFRLYKSWVHEGGISTPLIAHWPKGISPRGGLCHEPSHLIDIMPTCIELAGASYPPPSDLAGPISAQPHPLPGKSLAPTFHGKAVSRECIFWEHEANRALRKGKWKLVAAGEYGPWELYDMEEDRTESTDVSKEHPSLAWDMAREWLEIALRTDVFPLDSRGWFPRIKELLLPPQAAGPRDAVREPPRP